MQIVVQKFGGTSVATEAVRQHVIARIEEALADGYMPVVVVSAMGRSGDPYATDTLIELVRHANDRPRMRELDLAMACGEILAAVVLSQALVTRGHDTVALTGGQAGIITDDQFGTARILEVKTDRMRRHLKDRQIPVVTGFQGITAYGELTTLGRGCADTTAAVIGVALGARFVEIFTDVDGVKTADPRLVPDAATLRQVTYSEVVELAHSGAKVIHPRAVEVAMAAQMPLKIRSVTGGHEGTLITGAPDNRVERITSDRPVTGIAHVAGLALVTIRSAPDSREDLALQVFEELARAAISVDMIQVSRDQITFTIEGNRAHETEEVLASLARTVTVEQGFAKVSAVGAGMHGVPGVMARILQALAGAGVGVFLTTDSHANISCLVREEAAPAAVRALHGAFSLATNGARAGRGGERSESRG